MSVIDKLKAKRGIVKAVIYARFSSDNQRDESIDAQIRAIREYAKKQDVVIVEEYIDKARSATTDNRPEFLRMISDSAKEEFDIVLVHKLDRFARNRQDSIGYRMQLKRHGVSLISILEYIDESPESIILESVLEAMAEYYSKNLARETIKGLKENALKGLHTGGKPPFGYDLDKVSRKLVVNEHEAIAVRLIFERTLERVGYAKIADELNVLGYKTRYDRPFGKNSLLSIVRNEKYTGIYVYNKASSKDVDGKRNNSKHKDDEDIIRIKDAVPVIIPKETFMQVQDILKQRGHRTSSNRAKTVYLLSGKIRCGKCGYSMGGNRRFSGRNKIPHVTYRCMGQKNLRICGTKEIRREYIEAFVLEKLSEYLFSDSLIDKLLSEYGNYQKSLNSESLLQLKGLQSRLAEVKTESSNLINIMAKTGSDVLISKINELNAEQKALQESYERLKLETGENVIGIEELTEKFNSAKDMLKYGTLPQTKKIIQLFIDSVLIFDDRVEVVFNAHPDLSPDKLFSEDYNKIEKKYGKKDAFKSDKSVKIAQKNVSTLIGGYDGGGEARQKTYRKTHSRLLPKTA